MLSYIRELAPQRLFAVYLPKIHKEIARITLCDRLVRQVFLALRRAPTPGSLCPHGSGASSPYSGVTTA